MSYSEPLLNVKYFLSLFIPLLTKCLVKPPVNSGALFINYLAPSLANTYGILTSNSARVPPDCIILDN